MFSLFGRSKYIVLVSDGAKLSHCTVVETVGYNEGLVHRYRTKSGVLDMVYCSRKYRALEESGVFYIGKQLGNNSGAKLVDVTVDGVAVKVVEGCEVVGESSDKDCPGEDLSALIRSDFVGKGIKTEYGKGGIPWKWVIIVGVIALLIFGAVRFGGS